jgi:hypothetical protein
MISIFGLATAGMAHAQTWTDAYQKGLDSARQLRWTEARDAFKRAASLRTEDFSEKTLLPGSVTDPKIWRNGAPYSPNFLAAYSGYKEAMVAKDGTVKAQLLQMVVAEFKTLVAKNQTSDETIYFLSNAQVMLGDSEGQKDTLKLIQSTRSTKWNVDTEVVGPDEKAAIPSFLANAMSAGAGTTTTTAPAVVTVAPPADQPAKEQPKKRTSPTDDGGGSRKPKPKKDPAATATNPSGGTTTNAADLAVKVNEVPTKYALIVGNSQSRLGGALDFAASDSEMIKTQLMQHAGYTEGNIDVLTDVTAAQIMDRAKALAEKITGENAIVLIYFTGVGANLDGKDYLAGIDTARATDASTMVEKSVLFRTFMAKGAKIFAFFQVSRTGEPGRVFGSESAMVGQIAQMQATAPGNKIYSKTKMGKQVGLFTDAFSQALVDMRTNRVPIFEFGWMVFDKIRGAGGTGGGSAQIPTLPVYTNMGSDSRF